jgi:hypothetical protein
MTDELNQANRKLKILERLSIEKSQIKEIRLPDWPDTKRGTPNSFLRSALFSAVQSKDREYKKDEILFCQNGILIRYTGEQLNQDDLTLWETLIHLTRENPLNNVCEFSGYRILKEMKLTINKANYDWLEKGITRLMACVVKLTYENVIYSQSLITETECNEFTGSYRIVINRKLIKLYGDSNWTAINWDQRLQLRKKPLAQALLGYYSSHTKPYLITLLFIKRLTASKNKSTSDFKRKVDVALNELVKIGFLEGFNIDGELVSVVRKSVKKL